MMTIDLIQVPRATVNNLQPALSVGLLR